MRVDVVALVLGGLCFAVFAVLMTVAPQATMAMIGWQIPDGIATTEARAFYGGAELALAICLLGAAAKPAYRRAGLLLGFFSYGCVGATRLAGILIDGTGGNFLWGAFATEAALAILFAYAWTRSR